MKTIFLFIHHHSHIADLLRTDYIEYLSTKYKVIVFLPQREGKAGLDQNQYFKSDNVIYREQELKRSHLWFRFKLLRVSLVRQFDFLLSTQINYQRNKQKDRRRVFLRAISSVFPQDFFSTRFFTWIEGVFVPDEEFFSEAIKKYNPVLIITSTPGFTDFEAWAILLAKKHSIPTCAINFTWDNLTSNGKLIRKTDYLIVWNEIIKKEAITYHAYDPRNVFVSGSLRFDHYFKEMNGELSRVEFLKSKNLDPNLKTILIATMSKNNYPGHKELIQYILSLRETGKIKESFNILIRVHPIDHFDLYEDFTNSGIKNLHIECAGNRILEDTASGQKVQMNADDMLNLKHTLMYTDICINPFSTMSLEAMIFDKPVINIGLIPKYHPALKYIHYKPLIDSGSVRVAYTEKQLEEHINLYLARPETDQDNRKKIVQDFIGFTDGLSFMRNVDALDEIIKD